MFSCRKCNEPLYIRSAEIKDKILTMEVQCINGHKGIRRLAEHQAQDMSADLFTKMFYCLECGSEMAQISTEVDGETVHSILLCPIHGPQKREFPTPFLPAVSLLGADVNPNRAIIESFRCPECGHVYAVSDIENRNGILEVYVRCPNGHKDRRYLVSSIEESVLKKILQRVAHCSRCSLPGHIVEIEERRNDARVYVSCPVHGNDRKEIPLDKVGILREAVSEIPEDAVVRAMLNSSDCRRPLSIREIEEHKDGLKFKCICPHDGHTTTRVVPISWSESVKERIAKSIVTCDECGLLTHVMDIRKKRNDVEFRIVCPIHGTMDRKVPTDIFGYLQEHLTAIDRIPSIVRSLICRRCKLPLFLRDVEDRRGLIEFDVECRSGHRDRRFFVPGLDQNILVDIYKHFYKCPECHDPLDLVYAKPEGKESRVVLLCSLHGKFVLDVPHDHAEAMQVAYEEIQADRKKPPVEVEEMESDPVIEEDPSISDEASDEVRIARGCEIIGGKFDYKVKIINDTGYVITNVTVSLVAYPQDCMELAGESGKTISRVEVGGFRSPQFTLYPTKDCVQGKIVATVSYIDFRDHLHTLQVEPYLIRSVCDLLKPSEATTQEFDLILQDLTCTSQEQTLDWNAQVLFTKAEKLLPTKNFHVVDMEEKIVGGQFIGTIRGFAKGKYTGKQVAVVFMIMGPENGRHATVKVEALGEDIAMLPTTIDELADTMDSWICLRCGAPLESDQIHEMGQRKPIRCKYCAHSLTIALYLR
ncbi:MAG: hypothetical protein BAJATHORv1_30349 [Candidatus Thorarchaeota archaeon]|nr:MAG: hypothetical protein BAJATHORv1_30349 [Candidatus Thorarchaeota archaeon]